MSKVKLPKDIRKDIFVCIRFNKAELTAVRKYVKNTPQKRISSVLRTIVLETVTNEGALK